MKQRIIGYKLKDEKYIDAVAILIKSMVDFNKSVFKNLTLCVYNNPDSLDLLSKAGVMHWFEPVKEKEMVRVGRYTPEKIQDIIKFGCQEFNKSEVEAIYRLFDKEINALLKIEGQIITKEMVEKLLKMF